MAGVGLPLPLSWPVHLPPVPEWPEAASAVPQKILAAVGHGESDTEAAEVSAVAGSHQQAEAAQGQDKNKSFYRGGMTDFFSRSPAASALADPQWSFACGPQTKQDSIEAQAMLATLGVEVPATAIVVAVHSPQEFAHPRHEEPASSCDAHWPLDADGDVIMTDASG